MLSAKSAKSLSHFLISSQRLSLAPLSGAAGLGIPCSPHFRHRLMTLTWTLERAGGTGVYSRDTALL